LFFFSPLLFIFQCIVDLLVPLSRLTFVCPLFFLVFLPFFPCSGTACQHPYKERKKFAKGGRRHIKELHDAQMEEKYSKEHMAEEYDPHDEDEEVITFLYCIRCCVAPLRKKDQKKKLAKLRCMFFWCFCWWNIKRMKKKKIKHHGIDDKEHMTDNLTGCAKYMAIRSMLKHAGKFLFCFFFFLSILVDIL
jgi:hypothetical protein